MGNEDIEEVVRGRGSSDESFAIAALWKEKTYKEKLSKLWFSIMPKGTRVVSYEKPE